MSGSKVNYFTLPILSVLLLGFAYFSTGIRTDHFVLIGIVNLCYYISSPSRKLIAGLGIFIVYWIIYDSMKAWPNWAYNDVDITPLYNLEKKLFGIHMNDSILTPNEYFQFHHSSPADIITAIFYLTWVPLPLIFSFYLYTIDRNIFLRFFMAFFIVNCIGFVIYYLHPAAPPWYYAEHGSILDVHTKSNAAGLLRFDEYFGINLFGGLYSKGSNVFAAMPSLHASYPLIGFYYSLKQKRRWITVMFAIVMVGIWFSAIYLSHHYILDIIAGIGCGVCGIWFFEIVLMKTQFFGNFMKRYQRYISV